MLIYPARKRMQLSPAALSLSSQLAVPQRTPLDELNLRRVTVNVVAQYLSSSFSQRGGGTAGLLADEAAARRRPQERRPRHLRVRPRIHAALRLLRHAPRRVMFRKVREPIYHFNDK